MGMDVHGRAAEGSVGHYFRDSVWSWHPLWDYCCCVAPDIISADLARSGHHNDGEGLDGESSKMLAIVLMDEIDSGRCAEYELAYAARLAALPDEVCRICAGTGRRLPPPICGAGDDPCNGCGGDDHAGTPGTGKVRPNATYYPFNTSNVREFAAFLAACGGFEID